MSLSDLESVATFYSLVFRKPVGRHVILMCDSVSCWIMGCETVGDHLRRRLGIDLGQTTSDQEFTWLTIPCLGACDMAPVMMVDNVLCGPLTPELIDDVLDACVAAWSAHRIAAGTAELVGIDPSSTPPERLAGHPEVIYA